jgi:hypothetical protein
VRFLWRPGALARLQAFASCAYPHSVIATFLIAKSALPSIAGGTFYSFFGIDGLVWPVVEPR